MAATLSLGTRGYLALAREETAALIALAPTGWQTVTAHLRFPDGWEASFDLAGDDERSQPRTVSHLAYPKPATLVDMVRWCLWALDHPRVQKSGHRLGHSPVTS
jgi:hypothetical protein